MPDAVRRSNYGLPFPYVTQPFVGPMAGSTSGYELPPNYGGGSGGTLLGETNPLGSASAPGPDINAMLAMLAGATQIMPEAAPGPVTPGFVSTGPANTLTPAQSRGLTQMYGASPMFAPTAPASPPVPTTPPPATTPQPIVSAPNPPPDANVQPVGPIDANTGQPLTNLDQLISQAAAGLGMLPPGAPSPAGTFPSVDGGSPYQSMFGLPIPRGPRANKRGY